MKQADATKPNDPDSDEFGPIDSLRPIGEVIKQIVATVKNPENQESENGES